MTVKRPGESWIQHNKNGSIKEKTAFNLNRTGWNNSFSYEYFVYLFIYLLLIAFSFFIRRVWN